MKKVKKHKNIWMIVYRVKLSLYTKYNVYQWGSFILRNEILYKFIIDMKKSSDYRYSIYKDID